MLTVQYKTDKIESTFGQYRQFAGGNYNISICQVFECEKKADVSVRKESTNT